MAKGDIVGGYKNESDLSIIHNIDNGTTTMKDTITNEEHTTSSIITKEYKLGDAKYAWAQEQLDNLD